MWSLFWFGISFVAAPLVLLCLLTFVFHFTTELMFFKVVFVNVFKCFLFFSGVFEVFGNLFSFLFNSFFSFNDIAIS